MFYAIFKFEADAERRELKLSHERREVIERASASGVSRSVIAGILGGAKQTALAQIAEVLGPVERRTDEG